MRSMSKRGLNHGRRRWYNKCWEGKMKVVAVVVEMEYAAVSVDGPQADDDVSCDWAVSDSDQSGNGSPGTVK